MSDENGGDGSNPTRAPSRRDLLKLAGVAGAAAAAAPILLGARKARASHVGIVTKPIVRDAIVIGSGFGGAISALRLAEHGIDTLMLEKGKRWVRTPGVDTFSKYIYPDGRSTWLNHKTVVPLGPALPIPRHTGVLEGHDFGNLKVLTGAAYGGGSIVYGGLYVKPPRHLFERVFPAQVSYDDMAPYYQRVDAKVGISSVPDDVLASEYHTHYRVMEKHCHRAGIEVDRIRTGTDWNIVRQELAGTIPPSVIHGEAIYGVESGAKKTLDTNYLADAEATGMFEARTLRQVTDIAQADDGSYLIFVERLDERGRVQEEETYACRYLVLSAGSIGTSKLLVRAKATGLLPDLNDHVGKGWGNNGNVYALRTLIPESTGQWQGGPPSSAIKDYDNPIAPLYIEHPQLPLGLDLHYLLYFGMGIHSTRGQFEYNRWTDEVSLEWPRFFNDQNTVNRALMHTMQRLNRANGGTTSWLIGGPKGYRDDAVYHPLGGAVLGKACDFFGRVKNYDRLYVNDSALIPGFTGCANPAFTVSALAERNIERIIAEDL
jgi:cholesterol oxidase